MRVRYILPYALANVLLGTFVFLHGFFPLSFTSDERASSADLPDAIDDVPLNRSEYTRQVNRLVLMVIDAMRTDFVANSDNASMKYTNKQLADGAACLFNLQVESPTVTMPRIKAMITGTVPNFIDVVLNLGGTELKADSVLYQVQQQKKKNKRPEKIVFAGDNTWVKMFPDMFLRPLENVDSLFVNDFYEGDQNITHKLGGELKRNDWRMLILHFLGLDHIGHVEGPFSPKVPIKLSEMDQNIMHTDLAINEWKKTDSLPNMLLVTGDHGMRDTGGHGGSSQSEINVPLLMFGTGCYSDGTYHRQIDMAPTISVLLGLPIPASSIGTLIPGMLIPLTKTLRLYALYYNTERLLNKLSSSEGVHSIRHQEFFVQFEEARSAHKQFLEPSQQHENVAAFKRATLLYESASNKMSAELQKSFNKYDETSIWFGSLYVVLTFASFLMTIASPLNTLSFTSKAVLLFSIVASLGHYGLCRCIDNEMGLCFSTNAYLAYTIPALLIFGLTNNLRILTNARTDWTKTLQLIRDCPGVVGFLLSGIIIHALSLTSSSFIEEEHQTWYYLTTTLLVLLYFWDWKRLLQAEPLPERKNRPGKTKNAEAPTLINFLSGKNAADRYVWFQASWLHLFVMHLLARRLNQTGDKWLALPDIGDWLVMDDHRLVHSFFVITSLLLMIINCADYGSILTNVLTLTASVLIYYYRALTGSVYFAGVKQSDSTGACVILFWLNIFEIFAINFMPVLFKMLRGNVHRGDYKICLGAVITMFTLTSSLAQKPHNIFLNALLLITCAKLSATIHTLFKQQSHQIILVINCIAHFWVGKCFWFYQGNSNSLASIDLNAGYVGLSQFHFVPVTILLTINTYSGPLLAFLVLLYHEVDTSDDGIGHAQPSHTRKNEHKYITNIPGILWTLSALIAFPFSVYCFIVIAFRNHLFVWSVFSPKLLYEVYHLVLMSVFYCCTNAFLDIRK